MKKLLSFIVASFSLCSLFAEPLIQNNLKISKLALREISDGEDSSTFFEDEQDEKYEDKFEKRQKKPKGMRNIFTVSPLSLSFSSLNQIYADVSDIDIKPNLISYNIQLGQILMNMNNGFTFKYDVGAGISGLSNSLPQIAYKESREPGGFDLHLNVGLGWAPVRLEKFSLAILGSTGFHLGTPYKINCVDYGTNYKEIETKTYTQLYFDYNLGGEILATVHFNRVFGMFADLAFKGVFGAGELYGKNNTTGEKYKPSAFTTTGFAFLPTVGFVFTF